MRDEEVFIALAGMFCVFGLPFLGCMIWMVAHYTFSAFKTWQETALKRDMVARGYTVQEIVEVVAAGRSRCGKRKSHLSDVPPAKPIKQPAYNP
jgi:hypothetical protein